jgi:CO/xanthine dehydrogenase Mo-binding subunit
MAVQRGRGLATIEYPTGMNQGGDPSQAWIKVKPDGHVDVFSGTVDIGQGSKTVHTQIVADMIGVPHEWVTMNNADTDSSPVSFGTFASRGTFIDGNAIALAAHRVRQRLLELASRVLEVDPDDLEVTDGYVAVQGAPGHRVGVGEVAATASWTYGEMIVGSGAWMFPHVEPDKETGACEPHAALSYASCVAEVEVDDETGEVVVTRLVQVYDVGRAINPVLVEGQIQGGAIMGLGLALLEESYPYYPDIAHRGAEFGVYAAPGMVDLPELRSVVLEDPDPVGPFGAKAIGEMANNAQGPAIIAAIHDAVGVWVTELPAKPERVLRALDERRQPRRAGRRVIFDEHLSVTAVAPAGNRREGGWSFPAVTGAALSEVR